MATDRILQHPQPLDPFDDIPVAYAVFQLIFDAAHSQVVNTRYVYVNRAYCRMAGCAREDLVGRNFLDLYPEGVLWFPYCQEAWEKKETVHACLYSNETGHWLDFTVGPAGGEDRVAFIFTIMDETVQKTRRETTTDGIILHISKLLNNDEDFENGMNHALEELSRFIHPDRLYVLETDGITASNTFEWCAPGVEPEMETLQDLDYDGYLSGWEKYLKRSGDVVISDIEELKADDPVDYENLKRQGIRCLAAAPFYNRGKLIGYLGADNYEKNDLINTQLVLNSISYFIGAKIVNHRLMEDLNRLSCTDTLTNVASTTDRDMRQGIRPCSMPRTRCQTALEGKRSTAPAEMSLSSSCRRSGEKRLRSGGKPCRPACTTTERIRSPSGRNGARTALTSRKHSASRIGTCMRKRNASTEFGKTTEEKTGADMSTGDRNFGMGEDYLTGLPNIQAFYKRLEQERKRARDPLTEGELAVLYFNLVNFRLINLRYGLAAGDNAREAIRKLFPISVECSIGAGIWDDPTLKPEEVCYRARLASEQNRKHLHTYFSCYSKELGERLEIADYAVSHIEEAITLGWIHVYYQPIVRALTNQICGMEALARWEDPKYGMLAPDKFISPLEEARLIWKLDLSVIRQVVSGIANRCQRGMLEIPVSINLSRLDFLCCDIFEEIESIVRFYDVPRQMLHIEVTESVLTSYEDSIIQALEAFRRVGYEIWMDDFGSGYSTLGLLKDCSFDVLKMDMQFLNSDTIRSKKIIASVIQMDKDIGNRTLAEGVETKEQVEFLKKAGCDKLQGYYFGKPAPFGEMLRNCIAAGIGIESAKQKICYDQLCGVNFRTDVPFAIVEARGDALHLLHLGDRALSLFRAEGISDQRALEEKINDRSNPVCRELRKTA